MKSTRLPKMQIRRPPISSIIFLLILLSLTAILVPLQSLSQSFSSSSFRIDWGNFNMTSGKKTSSSYELTDTVGQNAPGRYDSNGFIVKSGFQYIYDSQYKLKFEINGLNINLGTLVPGIGSTATNTITISTPSGHGYQILASENHPLRAKGVAVTIPDTRCNSNSCSETSSGLWTSNTAYGFGFNVLGIDSSGVATHIGTSAYFPTANHYRQFADTSSLPAESPQIIMSETTRTKDHSARITYKALISGVQTAGTYENAINFIAIPLY